MPTYEYACASCGERIEVVQRFTDEPLTECPSCAGPLRKVFSAVGVVFKGSGFYKTDSRGSRSSSSPAPAKAEGASSSSSSSSSSSESSSPAAPAAPAADKPAAAAS